MSNLQIGRNTDGTLSITITDLTDTELSDLIRATITDKSTRAVTPAQYVARKRPPMHRYPASR